MNAVEIEEAVSKLIEQPFDAAEFPFAFLEAFGNKETTIRKLRSATKTTTNKTDVEGDGVVSVLQRLNIHIATCGGGEGGGGPDVVSDLLNRLVESPATTKHKAKFALATDGTTVQAVNLHSDEPPLVCEYRQFEDHFGFFLELAGISTVRQIRENSFDIKATGRLNRLYVELLKNNPEWDGDGRREDLNHFFARLIFCFFAEDTGIFHGKDLFTATVRQMSETSGENTHWVVAEVFRAMDIKLLDRDAANLRPFAGQFPYVNGGLFGSQPSPEGGTSPAGGVSHRNGNSEKPKAQRATQLGKDVSPSGLEPSAAIEPVADATGKDVSASGLETVPKFTQIARSYLLHIGSLDWTRINPDIFGSMIQAVADDEERGALGMHYTSVPNIRKVLDPLFLDDLQAKLEEAGTNARKLLNLRKRLARIRVFDPACGSGNFLVIAYKEMRAIEWEINKRRDEPERASDIPLTNFRGIELRHFAVEVARLALIIAEYQCDELYRGQRLALAEFLPLDKQNWITHGNALRLDWLKVCPPTGTGGVKITEDDLFQTPLDQPEIDFENEGGETYICGNPPYKGSQWQTSEQREDLAIACDGRLKNWKSLDYVAGWFMKATDYSRSNQACCALVSTNSICQGQQVGVMWPYVFSTNHEISFAHTSFKWANLASHGAGVTVVIVGLKKSPGAIRRLFVSGDDGSSVAVEVPNINAYLINASNIHVHPRSKPLCDVNPMIFGNHPYYAAPLILSREEARSLASNAKCIADLIRPFYGSKEYASSLPRACIWISEGDVERAKGVHEIAVRLGRVADLRAAATKDKTAQKLAITPHRFREQNTSRKHTLIIPRVSAEARKYHPVGILHSTAIVQEKAFAMYDTPVWNMSLIISRLHRVWINTVCARLRTDPSYSNTLGWNTFPVPQLTDQNKADLTRCAENILLAREAHWPATIAELYDPDKMPDDLRAAHDRNDETLERIYIGRRFKNDTERLETLFQMYTEMTAKERKV